MTTGVTDRVIDIEADRLPRLNVRGMALDSRAVGPGYLFAALPGGKVDGRDYIAESVRGGASHILAPRGTDFTGVGKEVTCLVSANPRRDFSLLVAQFYEEQPETIAAVTGTNGKTSVATFTAQIWQALGHVSASMGTMGLQVWGLDNDELSRDGTLTTPDPVALHRDLAALKRAGVEHVAMEASSHGLDQYRLDGVRATVAGFTNLSRDHLDYHGDMARYLAAKARLFEELLQPGGCAVLNADAPEFLPLSDIARRAGLTCYGYGRQGHDIRLVDARPTSIGQDLILEITGETYELHFPLIGDFQVMNALCALGMVLCGQKGEAVREVSRQAAITALEAMQPVRGRMEHVGSSRNGAEVFVDYAHTPDGLETVLKALRPHTKGRLHVVFGCGGDRDTGKRPQMAEICERLADKVIVTDDNPRSEDPDAIRLEIMTGFKNASLVRNIGARAEAIAEAISALAMGDVLVIAGKGHEQGQRVGDMVLPFDDASVARSILREEA